MVKRNGVGNVTIAARILMGRLNDVDDKELAYRVPRINGIDNCRYGVWRVSERRCEWLFPRNRAIKPRKSGNDK
jgi:hypothetical protein